MEISIQTSGLSLSAREAESMRTHVRQRIEEVFGWIKRRVTRVTVHITDISGPGGSLDKHCMVKVILSGGTALAQGSDRNPFVLVNRVSACAASITLKRLKRRRCTATIRKMIHPTEGESQE